MSEKLSGSASKSHAGMRAMEDAAEKILAPQRAERDLADAMNARFDAIEARKLSPEVQALNDQAELELFGSRGRTYTDPKTGAVIATADKPLAGKFESMLSDVKYGATHKERKEYAERSQSHLAYLLSQGLELSQAKLVLEMDDIQEDQKRYGKQVGDLIANGMAPEEASRQVMEKLAKVSELRLKRVLEGGVFTKEDYEAVRKGKDLYPNGAHVPTAPSESVPVAPLTEVEVKEAEEKKKQEEADTKKLENLKNLDIEGRKKLFVAAFGKDALAELGRPEGLMELEDQELLALAEKAEFKPTRGDGQSEIDNSTERYYQEVMEKALSTYRNASDANLKEIFKTAYKLTEEEFNNSAESDGLAFLKLWKKNAWHRMGAINIKDLKEATDADAIDMVFLAIENGYKVDGLTLEDIKRTRMPDTTPADPDKTTTPDVDLSSLTNEELKAYRKDAVVRYRALTDDQLESLLRAVYGNKAFDDESTHTREQKLEESRNISDEEAADLFIKAVNEKGFNFNAGTTGQEKLKKDQAYTNYYNSLSKRQKKKLYKRIYAESDIDWKQEYETHTSEDDPLDAAGIVKLMTYAVDSGLVEVDIDKWESRSDSPRQAGTQAQANERLMWLINMDKKALGERGSDRRKWTIRGLGATAAVAVVAGVVWAVTRDHSTVVAAADAKGGVGPLGAPGAVQRAALENLSQVPVRDGSGGYELVKTLGNMLHVDIPTAVWDQHQADFAREFPQYVVTGPKGEVWLKDIDLNTPVSQYNLSAMKDLVTSWTK